MSEYSFLVSTAVNEIHERYSELFGVEELAESLMVNKSYLIRRFKTEIGVSPGRYLQDVRIGRAKEYLLNPGYSIDVVAAFCGYSCANYFCKVFKKETGETPTEFRQKSVAQNRRTEPVKEEELEIYVL